jgi:hypothetical protein
MATGDIQSQIDSLNAQITALQTDPNYISLSNKLTQVGSGKDKNGNYYWIDVNGATWSGSDANSEHESAQQQVIAQQTKIAALQSQVAALNTQQVNLLNTTAATTAASSQATANAAVTGQTYTYLIIGGSILAALVITFFIIRALKKKKQ